MNTILVKTILAVTEVTVDAALEYTKRIQQSSEIEVIEEELSAIHDALVFIGSQINSTKEKLDKLESEVK